MTNITNRVVNPTLGGSSDDLVKPYLSQLTCKAVMGLLQRYWPDFMLFNYTLNGWLDWVDHGRGCENKYKIGKFEEIR